jgi:hypothetical protein
MRLPCQMPRRLRSAAISESLADCAFPVAMTAPFRSPALGLLPVASHDGSFR